MSRETHAAQMHILLLLCTHYAVLAGGVWLLHEKANAEGRGALPRFPAPHNPYRKCLLPLIPRLHL